MGPRSDVYTKLKSVYLRVLLDILDGTVYVIHELSDNSEWKINDTVNPVIIWNFIFTRPYKNVWYFKFVIENPVSFYVWLFFHDRSCLVWTDIAMTNG